MAPVLSVSGGAICITAGCNRQSWNGAAGQTCCRTCHRKGGHQHGPECENLFRAQMRSCMRDDRPVGEHDDAAPYGSSTSTIAGAKQAIMAPRYLAHRPDTIKIQQSSKKATQIPPASDGTREASPKRKADLGTMEASPERKKASLSKGDEAKRILGQMHDTRLVPAHDLVHEYDTNGSGRLGRKEVRTLLTDISKGRPVTDDELDFVLGVADANEDKVISSAEMSTVLNCWNNYEHCRKEIDQYFLKHDPYGTDRLDKDQLRGLLSEVSDGNPVSDADVNWVMMQACVVKDGTVKKPELRRVLAVWDTRPSTRQSCCTLQ